MISHEIQRQVDDEGSELDWLGGDVPDFNSGDGYEQKKTETTPNPREQFPKTCIEALRDREFLNKVAREYAEQYEPNGETSSSLLAWKQSLDDYVKKLLESPQAESFKNSEEFKNYCLFVVWIAQKRTMPSENGVVYPELRTNPVLNDEQMREAVLNGVYQGDAVGRNREAMKKYAETYDETLKDIDRRFKQGEKLSQAQLDILGDYVYLGRKYDDGRAKSLAEYCLNEVKDSDNIKATVPIIGALANYCAKSYSIDEDVRRRSNVYIADHVFSDGDMSIGVSYPFGNTLEKRYYTQMSLTSEESMKKSRTYQSNDLFFMMMVSFHELTHDHQRYSSERGETTPSATAHALKQILRKDTGCIPVVDSRTGQKKMVGYYDANHDSDETEIDADEEAWRQMRVFLQEHCKQYSKNKNNEEGVARANRLLDQCRSNEEEVRVRRAFSRKRNHEGELVDPVYYDIEKMAEKVASDPSLLENYPTMKRYFNEKGELRAAILLEEELAGVKREGFDSRTDNFGAEIGTYMMTEQNEVDRTAAYFEDKKLTEAQVNQLMENLWNILHQDILKIRGLVEVNTANYNETMSGVNQSRQELYNAHLRGYLRKLYNCTRIAEIVKQNNPQFAALIDEQEQLYLSSYYDELAKYGKLDRQFAGQVVDLFGRTKNQSLMGVAEKMRNDNGL